jgi:hypothetical protein
MTSAADALRSQGLYNGQSPLTSTRRTQGWSVVMPASPGESQLVLAETMEPSVVSMRFDNPPGGGPSPLDDAGTIVVETRVGEAVRRRTLAIRAVGIAVNVPAGVQRVLCASLAKSYTAWVQVSPGITTTENLGQLVSIAAGGNPIVPAPEFARSVVVTAVVGVVDVVAPFGVIALDPVTLGGVRSVELPAYGSVQLQNPMLTGASVSLVWSITA